MYINIDDLERDVTSEETLVEKAPAPHPKPLIPGLPESERLKRKKSRKKNMKSCERTPSPGKLQAEHFLHSPSLQLVKSSNISREFVFSEYDFEYRVYMSSSANLCDICKNAGRTGFIH